MASLNAKYSLIKESQGAKNLKKTKEQKKLRSFPIASTKQSLIKESQEQNFHHLLWPGSEYGQEVQKTIFYSYEPLKGLKEQRPKKIAKLPKIFLK